LDAQRYGPAASLRHVPVASSVAIAVAGTVALTGWHFDEAALKSMVPGFVAMNPATALCFILSGFSLALLYTGAERPARRRFGQICASIVALVGCVKLAGIASGWDSGIDRVLFSSKLDAYTPPNRMAPNTAFNFLLSGLALALIDAGAGAGRRPSKYLALVPLLLSFLALTGYTYEVRSFYGLGSYIPMASIPSWRFSSSPRESYSCTPRKVSRRYSRATTSAGFSRGGCFRSSRSIWS
jgi:hypothetical protein